MSFTLTTPTQEPPLDTAMKVIYQWNYEPEVEELRRLYVKATEAQWVAERAVDWERPIDHQKFATTPLGAAIPIEQTSYWKSLSEEQAWELTRRTASFRLSNFLHGEQGALMVAAQLVNAVPHTDAKFYAATQTMDEARHVDVFAKYIKKLDEVRPIAPALRTILDATLQTDDWMKKLVGMQIVVEGLALYSFREMRNLTEEPLLKDLLTYVARDESRHHAYGVQYIERCAPCLGDAEREELEDFALEAARSLIDQRNQTTFLTEVMKIWAEIGSKAEVTSFNLTGYSLGGTNAAFVAKLDEERKAFNFDKVLLLNPSVELYSSISQLDRFLENIPGGVDNFDKMFQRIVERIGAVYRKQTNVSFSPDLVYDSVRENPPRDEELAALIGVSFRMSSSSLIFTSDVMTNQGFIKPANEVLARNTALDKYVQVSMRVGFTDYFHEFAWPYYRAKSTAKTREEFADQQSLVSIKDYLAGARKIGVVDNHDDIILAPGEIDFLTSTFDTRAKIFPVGGHLGNLEQRETIAYIVDYFKQ